MASPCAHIQVSHTISQQKHHNPWTRHHHNKQPCRPDLSDISPRPSTQYLCPLKGPRTTGENRRRYTYHVTPQHTYIGHTPNQINHSDRSQNRPRFISIQPIQYTFSQFIFPNWPNPSIYLQRKQHTPYPPTDSPPTSFLDSCMLQTKDQRRKQQE